MNNSNSSWPLSRYTHFRKIVSKDAAQWFNINKFEVSQRQKYILNSPDDWSKNIILPDVVGLINKDKIEAELKGESYALHKYLHHGLSSQALLFNLFGPLKIRNDFSPLRDAFLEQAIPFPDSIISNCFEYTDRKTFNEIKGQPTSIDFMIEGPKGTPKLFIESKFVEQEFGGCSVFKEGDCDGRNPISNTSEMCYLAHLGRKYWELLQKHGFISGHIEHDALCILSVHYQYFREVLFALEQDGIFVLLYDERNPTFYNGNYKDRGLMPLLITLTPDHIKEKIRSISIQQIVKKIELSSVHKDWIREFKLKYGL